MFDTFVITISYGDYTVSNGGTDKYLLSHQKIFNNNQISVVHIYPTLTKKFWMSEYETHLWGMLIDGEKQKKDIYTTQQIFKEIYDFSANRNLKAVLIHSFLFMDIKKLYEITSSCQAKCYFFIHDFLTLCPSLLDHTTKTLNYCELELPEEKRCAECVYYTKAFDATNSISDFFGGINDFRVVAPSKTAKRIWCYKHYKFENIIQIIPHQKFVGEYKENLNIITEDQPVRLAFVGVGAATKGWLEWIEAVKKSLQRNLNYQFFHFGTVDKHFDFIKEIGVDFRINNNAMIDTIRSNDIDIAVLWSLCPETYSYTFYESFSSNCFIITNENSGNIAEQVKDIGNGIVATEESLSDILTNEQFLRLKLNEFKASKKYGPLFLEDNDELEKEILGLDTGKVCINNKNKDHCIFDTAYITYIRLKQTIKKLLHYHC